jgi:hypothetical protein
MAKNMTIRFNGTIESPPCTIQQRDFLEGQTFTYYPGATIPITDGSRMFPHSVYGGNYCVAIWRVRLKQNADNV